VLPSDQRYQELLDEEINILFLYHVIRPTEEQLKEFYRQESAAEVAQKELPVDLLKGHGWTAEQIARIKEDIPLSIKGQ
jgi:hypothetical protein